MSNCGNIPLPEAEALVAGKFELVETIAQQSVSAALAALTAIGDSAGGEISEAGKTIGAPGAVAAGVEAVGVEYQKPDEPDQPDFGWLAQMPEPPAYTGSDEIEFSTLTSQAPVFSGITPGVVRTPDIIPNPVTLTDFAATPPVATPPTFVAPTPPTAFADVLAVTPVTWQPVTAPAAFLETAPEPPSRAEPTLTATPPTQRPDITMPAYPESPVVALPADPGLSAVPLPTLRLPDLSQAYTILAEVRGQRPATPTLTLPESPRGMFDELLGTLGSEITPVLPIQAVLTWMLAGHSLGIPEAVANLLRDRAFAAEDRLAFQAEQAGFSDWLARGFTLPGAVFDAQLQRIRQQTRDKKAELNRNLWIEEAKLEIEALRFAVTAGIQYESALWDAKLKRWTTCGALAAQFADVQLKVLDATLSVYQAQLTAWQTEAGILKDYLSALLQAEMSKVEITKAEVEIARFFVQLNGQTVDLYKTKIDSQQALVGLYKAQVDAANSRLQADALRLEVFAKEVQAYSASVAAYEAEWRGFAAAVQGDAARVEAFKARIQAHESMVTIYGKQVDAEKERVMAGVAINQIELERHKARATVYASEMDGYGRAVQAESARIQAEVEIAKLPVEVFKASAQAYSAKADAYGRAEGAATARFQAETEAAKLPMEIYKTHAQAFAAQAEVYGKTLDAKKSEVSAKIEIEKLKLESFRTTLAAYQAELARASTEIEAKSKVHGAQVQLFGAKVDSEKARVNAELQVIDQQLRNQQFLTSITLKQAELDQTKALELAKIALQGDVEIGRIASQLAGAALSAVNASASIGQSYSATRSASCSETYSYEM